MLHVGLDLSRKRVHVHVRNDAGETVDTCRATYHAQNGDSKPPAGGPRHGCACDSGRRIASLSAPLFDTFRLDRRSLIDRGPVLVASFGDRTVVSLRRHPGDDLQPSGCPPDSLDRGIESIARVANPLPDGTREYNAASAIFALASVAITAGSLLGCLPRRRPRTAASTSDPDIRSALARLPTGGVLLGVAVVLILAILAVGPAEILNRGFYLERGGPPWLAIVSDVLVPLGVAGAAAILFGERSQMARLIAVALVVGYTAVLLSKDTRELALVPLIVFALYIAQRTWHPSRYSRAACGCVLVVLAPALPRASRAGSGRWPDAVHVSYRPRSRRSVGRQPRRCGRNVLYSVPLTGYIATDVGGEPNGALAISLTPLPGDVAGWTNLAPVLRVSIYTPFNTLGELALQGMFVLIAFFVVVGYLTTRMQAFAKRLHALRSAAMQLALGGLIAAFSVSALQYNLRSTTRYVWYALGLYLVLQLVPVLKKPLQSVSRYTVRPSPPGSRRTFR